MLIKSTLTAAAFALVNIVTAHAADQVGFKTVEVKSDARSANLKVSIWYPATQGGTIEKLGENRLFVGNEASVDAPMASGKHPLVLISHGSGGNMLAASWLATRLAEAGFVVAGPNHPGTTSGDSLPAETPKVWKRTRDLSDVIDYLEKDVVWGDVIDPARIGVVGFSLGGAAAMEIAGARANLEDYARYCDTYGLWDCGFYAGGRGYQGDDVIEVGQVDLRKIERDLFEQSNHDERIKVGVMIDPGLVPAFDLASVRQMSIPLTFINLGDKATIPYAVYAERLARIAPKANYVTVAGANHFSFLSVCKTGAAEFLRKVGEPDPICSDASDRSRQSIHEEISEATLKALSGALQRH